MGVCERECVCHRERVSVCVRERGCVWVSGWVGYPGLASSLPPSPRFRFEVGTLAHLLTWRMEEDGGHLHTRGARPRLALQPPPPQMRRGRSQSPRPRRRGLRGGATRRGARSLSATAAPSLTNTAGHVMGRDEEPWTRHRTRSCLFSESTVSCRPSRGGPYLVKGNRQPRSEKHKVIVRASAR